jgi:hypothetical protein
MGGEPYLVFVISKEENIQQVKIDISECCWWESLKLKKKNYSTMNCVVSLTKRSISCIQSHKSTATSWLSRTKKKKKKPLQCACCRRWARRSPSASPNEPQEVDDGRWRHARYSRGSGYLFKDDQYLSVTQSCVMFQVSTIRYVCEIWPKTRKCICRYHRLQKIDIESQVVKFQICPWLAPMASWRRAHSNNKCSSASARGINPLFTAGKRLWIRNRDENCGQKDTSTLTSVV